MSVDAGQPILYVDFAKQFATERDEIMAAVERTFARGDFIGGTDIEQLENELAAYLGVGHVIAVNSGTDALIFALTALGIGPGDEVITAANSFVASAAAIARIGATPVFADVGSDQLLDPTAVGAAVTPRTRAIMPVHLTGRVADMPALSAVASRHGLAIVEDAAQAFGSRLNGLSAGSFGIVNAFSTHPLKNLNAAGDGGFLTTDDVSIAERVRRMRNHGFRDRDTSLEFGLVSRMDTLQAAVLRCRLPRVEALIARRRSHAERYHRLLNRDLTWYVDERAGQFNSYHLFVIQTEQRDELAAHLRAGGIGSKVHYPVPIHLQPAASALGYRPGALPQTERQARTVLSLPIHQFLSEDDIERVAAAIDAFFINSTVRC